MGVEIERKFLLADDGWRGDWPVTLLRQGYLLADPALSIRVRSAGPRSFLTIKGKGSTLVRPEFEYEIPAADAEAMLGSLCQGRIVEKRRHEVRHDGRLWTVDEFLGRHAGLLLAEVELDAPDQVVTLPSWVGREVTYDPRYQNAVLAST